MTSRELAVHRVGRIPYGDALALQERLVAARKAGEIGDVLLLLEHPPVVTLGRGASEQNLLLARPLFEAKGFEVHDIGRGGDVTYHGPGQLVGYPIIDLSPDRRDVRKYVSSLEETMIRVCGHYGVRAARISGMNGTWLGSTAGTDEGADRKIGAVGVRISRWVTMHGFALNVTTDLSHFSLIVPCGLTGKGVTSLAEETGRDLTMGEVIECAATQFATLHDARISWHDGAPS